MSIIRAQRTSALTMILPAVVETELMMTDVGTWSERALHYRCSGPIELYTSLLAMGLYISLLCAYATLMAMSARRPVEKLSEAFNKQLSDHLHLRPADARPSTESGRGSRPVGLIQGGGGHRPRTFTLAS